MLAAFETTQTVTLDAPVLTLVESPVDSRVFEGFGRAFKRTLDVAGALALLIVTLPLFLVLMVAVRLDSSGGAIFSQERCGKDGRRFRIHKFRTMVADNDDSAHRAYTAALIRGAATANDGVFKLVDDPRITRVGRFLRKTSLDELPQLWNVLKGDMSLVGPRPALPHEVDLYDDRARLRMKVKPGVTGLWQVSGRCETSFGEMIDLDVEYWMNWRPTLDLKILLRTPVAVLSGRGAA